MRPAVFLDRDGVLTKESFAIMSPSEMQIFEYAKGCVSRIHDLGYFAIVVTNQSGVARGLFSEDELIKANRRLTEITGVDAVYYCPHHPYGIVEKYARHCTCRKPGTGMIEQAQKEYDIVMSESYMVGDRASDILTGINAGLKTVLLESGYGMARLEQPVDADFYCKDLKEFVYEVLK